MRPTDVMYRSFWTDLRARGILGRIDAERPEEVSRAIARCERMLAKPR